MRSFLTIFLFTLPFIALVLLGLRFAFRLPTEVKNAEIEHRLKVRENNERLKERNKCKLVEGRTLDVGGYMLTVEENGKQQYYRSDPSGVVWRFYPQGDLVKGELRQWLEARVQEYKWSKEFPDGSEGPAVEELKD